MIKSVKASQHIHTVEYRIYLANDNHIGIAEYCVKCGKVISRRMVKTEPMEVKDE